MTMLARTLEALFRIVLVAFPAPLRRKCGDEIVESFRATLRERLRSGNLAGTRYGILATADVMKVGIAERWRSIWGYGAA